MSVLSFPRIYFKGYASWDPCTFNNNDFSKFPTFNAAQAALNWPFLAIQDPPITPENFTQTFRPYAIKLQNDSIDSPAGARVPCEWNMFGSHATSFVQYENYTTAITGGALAYNQPAVNDPLIGAMLTLFGDNDGSAPKLVDTNPSSFWSSQIYYGSLTVGSGNYSVSGPRAARMHSRWINLNRIYDATGALTQPAAAVGCCFQACIPNSGIAWQNGAGGASSPLLTALQNASTQPGAQGVMVRFTAYVNMYFVNGILNNIQQQPRNYADLAELLATAWKQWNDNGSTSEFFSQPCYSHVVGSVGVWNEGELASVPLGRYLSAQAAVTPVGGSASTQLGPAAAQVDYQTNILSLDLGSAIPEVAVPGTPASNLEKVNLGTLTVGIQTGSGFVTIGELDTSQYGKAAYEASAGIVDLPIPTGITAQQLEQGLLAIQANSGGQMVNALGEQAFCAQTDSRGIYLDQDCQDEFQITVLQQGAPAAGAKVLLAQYDQNLNLVPSGPPQYISFTVGEQRVVNSSGGSPVATIAAVVTADENGIATAGVAAQTPGFPVVAFFPFSGDVWPAPPPSLMPGVGNTFYATVRVLPFDDALPQEFLDLWNSTQDPVLAWNFVYTNILYVYDMIFSVMLNYVNLGSQSAVDENAQYIAAAIAAPLAAEATSAMPVTRDLSRGKRATLQHYLNLIQNNYSLATLSLESVDSK
ncbi:MAG TPA: hypothetical protein VFK06_02450 [Candidatus Angelobacter sp.]|nr:hypothetical protein [Candidatus Angelobacter sp.]